MNPAATEHPSRDGTGHHVHRIARRRAHQRWPYVIVAFGELAVLGAVATMAWASMVDDHGRVAFTTGPTRLLVTAALASLVFSFMTVVTNWPWLRWFMAASTMLAALTAVAVALSSIAAANTSLIAIESTWSETTWGPGAVIGIGAALITVGSALAGIVATNEQTAGAALGYLPPPPASAPTRPQL